MKKELKLPVCDKHDCNFYTLMDITVGKTNRGHVGQIICAKCKHAHTYDLYTRLEVGE